MFSETFYMTIIGLLGFIACLVEGSPSNDDLSSANPLVKQNSLSSASDDVKNVVETFIRKYQEQHQVTIIKHELKKLDGSDGSFVTSGIQRLHFYFKKGNEVVRSSVLLKIPDEKNEEYGYAKKMLYFEKEEFMYNTVIPLMYENVPFENVAPEFYGCTESGVLIMENLVETNFDGKKKGPLFDLRNGKVVLRLLAQFHALSIKHLDKVSTQLDKLTIADRGDVEWAAKGFLPYVEKFRKHVFPMLSEEKIMKFNNFVDNIRSVMKLGHSVRDHGLNVVLHGDAHSCNMLYVTDEKKNIQRCKFIDFQGSRRGSPVVDVVYFLMTSVQTEVFDENRDELYNYYLQEFKTTLEQLGIGHQYHYDRKDFDSDFEWYKPYFLYVLVANVPTIWLGGGGIFLTETPNASQDKLDILFKSKEYVSTVNSWVQYLL